MIPRALRPVLAIAAMLFVAAASPCVPHSIILPVPYLNTAGTSYLECTLYANHAPGDQSAPLHKTFKIPTYCGVPYGTYAPGSATPCGRGNQGGSHEVVNIYVPDKTRFPSTSLPGVLHVHGGGGNDTYPSTFDIVCGASTILGKGDVTGQGPFCVTAASMGFVCVDVHYSDNGVANQYAQVAEVLAAQRFANSLSSGSVTHAGVTVTGDGELPLNPNVWLYFGGSAGAVTVAIAGLCLQGDPNQCSGFGPCNPVGIDTSSKICQSVNALYPGFNTRASHVTLAFGGSTTLNFDAAYPQVSHIGPQNYNGCFGAGDFRGAATAAAIAAINGQGAAGYVEYWWDGGHDYAGMGPSCASIVTLYGRLTDSWPPPGRHGTGASFADLNGCKPLLGGAPQNTGWDNVGQVLFTHATLPAIPAAAPYPCEFQDDRPVAAQAAGFAYGYTQSITMESIFAYAVFYPLIFNQTGTDSVGFATSPVGGWP